MTKGKIVAGVLAPHPPHLVYAENAEQNEAKATTGWETLRWGYERCRKSLATIDYDVLLVHSPHWRTNIGTHFLGVPNFKSISVDPVFPNLFRYHYDLNVDVDLSESIASEAKALGLDTHMMRNPDFRVDYGTIISCHMVDASFKKPIVGISSIAASRYAGHQVMQELMLKLGEATGTAVEKSGKRAVLLASNSLSHLHFTSEPDVPEDMTYEHVFNNSNYVWDMKMLNLMKAGESRKMVDLIPEFNEKATAETESGSLTWMMSAMDFPTYPAEVHGYGNVIGTGNAVVEWRESEVAR